MTTRTPSKLIRIAWLVIASTTIITIDQMTKYLVVEYIPFLETWLPDNLSRFSDWFRIVHWHNSGAAFGIFQNANLLFLILGIAAVGFILFLYPTIGNHEWALSTAMILQLGGAVGNMIDRIRFGHVIDFISIMRLPVFNIADASIALGVLILLLDVLWAERSEKKSQHSPSPNPPTLSREND
ncbi:MAG: signal peptidase II [Anaerolineales bacterium]|nr:signal peptidase II [Anaerolineales bacterium]